MPHQLTKTEPPRILVVDDEEVHRKIVGNVAIRCGLNVVYAASVEAAIESISARSFDFITIDLSLGERDGIELLRLIGSTGTNPRVIVISGCEERILNATIRMARAVGICDAISLPKPLNLSLLREVLKSRSSGPASVSSTSPSAGAITADQVRTGLGLHQFRPAFQPKVRISDGALVGCEVLARWENPQFGAVSPKVFIPALEEAGLIQDLTLSLLDQSIRDAREFVRRDPNFVLAVNVSANLLSDLLLPEEIEAALQKYDVAPRSLMLEITESTAMSDVSRAIEILVRLRIKGVGVSIDDFGTGYSSLTALSRMPFSELKIDQSFVDRCTVDPDLWKIVRGTVALAHEFGMKVVAEGIEDWNTHQALRSIGCDIGQGFWFSRALDLDGFLAWWDDWKTRVVPRRHRAAVREFD